MSLIIDREKFLVLKESEEINLSKKEFEMLWLLSTNPGKVYSRRVIFDQIWGIKSLSKERTVDVHMVNLRKKLGTEIIRTIKGVGYKITDNNVKLNPQT